MSSMPPNSSLSVHLLAKKLGRYILKFRTKVLDTLGLFMLMHDYDLRNRPW